MLAKGLEVFIKVYRIAEKFGLKNQSLSDAAENFEAAKPDMEQIIQDIKEFSEIFGEHGWTVTDSLNNKVARKAVAIAKEQSLEEAEAYLADFWDENQLDLLFKFLYAFTNFEDRRRILELAKD